MSTQLTLQADELTAMLADPRWWEGVCYRVAMGESPHAIAQGYGVKFALFRGWISGDPVREKQYREAIEHRDEGRRETVAAGVFEMATAPILAELIRPSDKMKAAEMFLNGGKSGNGLTVQVGEGSGRVTVEIVRFADSSAPLTIGEAKGGQGEAKVPLPDSRLPDAPRLQDMADAEVL